MWNNKPKTNRIVSKTIAIDFDGTCVANEFPLVGKDIGAKEVLLKLIKNNHKLILHTVRDGTYLTDAVEWFKSNDIKLHAINESIDTNRSKSNKPYAHLYIDDRALGCPLTLEDGCKPYVNWLVIDKMLFDIEYIKI